MPVANAPAEACYIRRSMHAINDEEVISAGARFYKGNYSGGRTHSCSLLPNILTLENTQDSCSRTFRSSSWVLTHFTENTTRELASAETALISSQIPSKLPGENGEKGGAETDEHVRPQARGLMF